MTKAELILDILLCKCFILHLEANMDKRSLKYNRSDQHLHLASSYFLTFLLMCVDTNVITTSLDLSQLGTLVYVFMYSCIYSTVHVILTRYRTCNQDASRHIYMYYISCSSVEISWVFFFFCSLIYISLSEHTNDHLTANPHTFYCTHTLCFLTRRRIKKL